MGTDQKQIPALAAVFAKVSEGKYPTATVRGKGRVTIPEDVRLALDVQEGERFDVSVTEEGSILLRRRIEIDADQGWFWTPAWQERIREAQADIIAGRTTKYDSTEEFLAALDEHIERD